MNQNPPFVKIGKLSPILNEADLASFVARCQSATGMFLTVADQRSVRAKSRG
jgi:hypothetical protein